VRAYRAGKVFLRRFRRRRFRIAFIVGCARSGTSILGELIGAHPRVRYIFEAHDLWNSMGEGEDESHRLLSEHATSANAERVRRWI